MKSNAKYFIAAIIIAIGVVGVSFYSCEKEEIVPNETSPTLDPTVLDANPENTIRVEAVEDIDMPAVGQNCGNVVTKRLMASGNETVGNVNIYNDEENYIIEVGAARGWYFSRAFAQIAFDMAKFPLDKEGNPDYMHFEYVVKDPAEKKFVSFKIPLNSIEFDELLTSLAVEVYSNPERPGKKMVAWAQGKEYGDRFQGTAYPYHKQACLTTEAVGNDIKE